MLNERYISLIKSLIETGSLNKTAKKINKSYKTVWSDLKILNDFFEQKIFETQKGGVDGGGVFLTEFGINLMKIYDELAKHYDSDLSFLMANLEKNKKVEKYFNRITIKTSARNQFFGTVINVSPKGINSLIEIETEKGDKIKSVVTNESVDVLSISKGNQIYMIFKANWVELISDINNVEDYNLFTGIVSEIIKGDYNSEVIVKTKNNSSIVAVCKNNLLKEFKIKLNKGIIVGVKYKNIIVGV